MPAAKEWVSRTATRRYIYTKCYIHTTFTHRDRTAQPAEHHRTHLSGERHQSARLPAQIHLLADPQSGRKCAQWPGLRLGADG